MGRHRLLTILAALLVAMFALPAFAQASGDDVIRDCSEDGTIDGSYSADEYREAEENLPSDVDQYTDCRDVIAQGKSGKRKNGAGGTGNPGGGGTGGASGQSRRGGSPKPYEGDPALATRSGAYAPNQDDKTAYERARADAARGASLPGGLAVPSAGDFTPASPNSLPLPVVLAMAAVALLVAATLALVARKRLPALNRVASRFRRG